MNKVHLVDCMEFMKGVPDKHYDLAIADPPYGIGQDWKKRKSGTQFQETTYDNKAIPPAEYFRELKRISKDQIIWGYNYYTKYLGPTNYLIIWDKIAGNTRWGVAKRPEGVNYSRAEIAYTTKKIPCNIVAIPWDGNRRGNETGIEKIHPHQKPLDLYRWTLMTYANPGDTIFDSHVGSGSIRIACHDLGFDFEGCEIDPDIGRLKRTAIKSIFYSLPSLIHHIHHSSSPISYKTNATGGREEATLSGGGPVMGPVHLVIMSITDR